MFIHGPTKLRRAAARAFTLLEVMVAVLIISMLMLSVYRFVKSVLLAVTVSTDATVAKQEMAGFINFLQTELEDLPAPRPMILSLNNSQPIRLTGNNTYPPLNAGNIAGNGTLILTSTAQPGMLIGTPHSYSDLPADELEWVCPAGQGLLTTAGSGQYRVTLAIQNAKGKTSDYEIGLRRRASDAAESNYSWLPLLRPAAALEIRYFEPRGKQWIEAWQDQVQRPSLVRVRVWRNKVDPPYVAVLALPTARVQ